MTIRSARPSTAAAARIAGLGLLAMAVPAFFAFFFALADPFTPGAALADGLLVSERLFRGGIAALVVVLLLDVVVAWALYVLLEPVNERLALLAAWFRLAYTAVHGAALLGLVLVLPVAGATGPFASLDAGARRAWASLFIEAHGYGFVIGLVFFGFHLLVLSRLVCASGYLPKILGGLLFLAALGYLTDGFARLLMPDYADYETLFLVIAAVPTTIGELSLAFWLAFKGAKVARTGRPATAAT